MANDPSILKGAMGEPAWIGGLLRDSTYRDLKNGWRTGFLSIGELRGASIENQGGAVDEGQVCLPDHFGTAKLGHAGFSEYGFIPSYVCPFRSIQ